MANVAWGIDISRYSIKAVRLEAIKGGGARLTAMDIVTIPPPPEGETTDAAIVEALQGLKKKLKIGGASVAASMPGHTTFNRIIKLPPVEPEKMDEIVKYEAQSQIPFPLEEVLWDYQPVERDYLAGEEMEVMLFAVKKEVVESFLTSIEAAALSVDVVQFAPVAMYNYLHHDLEKIGGTIALDFGAENADLMLTDGARFWIRNIPVTGNQLTKVIAEKFKKTFAEAEQIKRKAAQSKNAQTIYNAIQPVYSELTSEIHRSLGYFKSVSRSAQFDKIVLMGNGARALNLQRYLSQSLRMPANRLEKLAKIEVGPTVDQAALAAGIGSLATALGLGLQALGQAKNKVNLLPVRFVQAKQVKKKEPMAIGAALLLLVTSILSYVWASGRRTVMEEKLRHAEKGVEKYLEDYKRNLETVKGKQDLTKEVQQLQVAEQIYAPRDYFQRILKEINPNIPDNSKPDEGPESDAFKNKLWILSWKFTEEIPKDAQGQHGLARAPASAPPPGGIARFRAPGFILPNAQTRILRLELEVAIAASYSAEAGSEFIRRTLLNYDRTAKKKVDPTKPSALAVPGLWVPREEPDVEKTQTSDIAELLPTLRKRPDEYNSEEDKSKLIYHLYMVRIEYRPGSKPAAAPAAAPNTGG
jgi:type IV pilus assembly protein PilM